MALSQRERVIVTLTGLAAAVFLGDRYVLTPYFDSRKAVADERNVLVDKLDTATRTFSRQNRLLREERQWKQTKDPAEAERQLLAVRDWAQEAGLTNVSTTPRREPRNDSNQIVRLDASANGSLAAVAKLLWRVEKAEAPLKVDELDLRSRTDGADDLQVSFKVSTIWVTDEPQGTGAGTGGRPGAPGPSDGTGAPRRPARREDL